MKFTRGGDALLQPACYFQNADGLVPDGAISQDKAIIGTYLHGLFDRPEALQQLLLWAGVTKAEVVDINQQREISIERLAKEVEAVFAADFLDQWSPT